MGYSREVEIILYSNDFQGMLDYVLGSNLPEQEQKYFTSLQLCWDERGRLNAPDIDMLRKYFERLYVLEPDKK